MKSSSTHLSINLKLPEAFGMVMEWESNGYSFDYTGGATAPILKFLLLQLMITQLSSHGMMQLSGVTPV